MATPNGDVSRTSFVPDFGLGLTVYVLYFLGYFTGVAMLVGAVIAHVKVDTADPLLRSHYRFQIGTFWLGIGFFVLGVALFFSTVFLGALLIPLTFVWSLIRNVKGVLALNDRRAITQPKSWLFG